MDLERAVSFPDWTRVLDAETGLDRADRNRYRWAIGEYLGYLKATKQRASLATAKAYFEGKGGRSQNSEVRSQHGEGGIQRAGSAISRDQLEGTTKLMAQLMYGAGLRHRACLTLIYTCGLRLGEGCRLEVGDIQRARGLIHIRAAKGNKDRYVPIPAETLEILTECWKSHRNPRWLFPRVGRGGVHGAGADQPVPISTVQQAFRKAMLSTGQRKDVHVHTLRHSYATHLLEDGHNLRQIQVWLGHGTMQTTEIYTHLTTTAVAEAVERLNTVMARP